MMSEEAIRKTANEIFIGSVIIPVKSLYRSSFLYFRIRRIFYFGIDALVKNL